MIVTLTPNPSIDRTLTVPEISFNDAIRVQRVRLDWGGKGFNVSRALKEFGIDSIVIAWVGGGSGKMLADGIQSLGIQTDFVWVEGDTRTNTSIIENQSDWRIKANEPGPHITTDDIDQMFLKKKKKKYKPMPKKGIFGFYRAAYRRMFQRISMLR